MKSCTCYALRAVDCTCLPAKYDEIYEIYTTPEQKPVALKMDEIVVNLVREGINKHRARELAEHFIKHTITPPQRNPLSDEEILTYRYMIDWTAEWSYINFARAIEAAHGIK